MSAQRPSKILEGGSGKAFTFLIKEEKWLAKDQSGLDGWSHSSYLATMSKRLRNMSPDITEPSITICNSLQNPC